MKEALLAVAWGILVLVALPIGSAQAAEADAPFKCNPAGNQQEMNMCALDDYRTADAVLNIRYGEVMQSLSPQMRSALRTEQRAWLKGRDPACKREAKANEGGSIWPLVFYGCLERLTRTRITELDRWKDREK